MGGVESSLEREEVTEPRNDPLDSSTAMVDGVEVQESFDVGPAREVSLLMGTVGPFQPGPGVVGREDDNPTGATLIVFVDCGGGGMWLGRGGGESVVRKLRKSDDFDADLSRSAGSGASFQ